MYFCDYLVSLTLSKSKMAAKYRQYTGYLGIDISQLLRKIETKLKQI